MWAKRRLLRRSILIRKAFRNIISISRWSLIALSIFPVSTAHADGRITVTEPTDYWITFDVPTQFLAQTYQSDGFESDPQLWLYNADTGEEIASNDDYIGLQSKIDLEVPAGNYRLRAATCCGDPNAWRDGWGWNIQYELSYNGIQSAPPTTTIPETTTTTPETTTTWPETTTSTTSTTTSTTTAPTTSVPVTEVPITEATTTTTSTTTTTTLPLATTSTTVVDTVAPSTMPTTTQTVGTVEVPQTSLAPTTSLSPFFPTPLTTLPNTTTTSLAPTTTLPIITEPTESPTTSINPPNEETTNPDTPTSDISNEVVDELLSSITELSDEEITNLVESIDVSKLTEESISAVFSEEVLNELSDDQVTELIDAIVPSELSDDQALALSEALTDAPDNVKQEFEQQVDVFGGKFDTYIPTGSAVSVGARRVLVAAAAASFAMPAPSSSSRKQK